MAENEILDLGNPRRYRKWRSALSDSEQSPERVAGFLEEEFISVVRNSLQRTPLHLILKACSEDVVAMRGALEACKNRDLARSAEQAYHSTRSKDVDVLADHIAIGLIDRVLDRVQVQASRHIDSLGPERYRAVVSATEARLEACRGEITALLSASLREGKIPRRRAVSNQSQSSRELAGQSLLMPVHRWSQGPIDHA